MFAPLRPPWRGPSAPPTAPASQTSAPVEPPAAPPPPRARGPGGRGRRALRAAALAVVGLELAYVLAANVALESGFVADAVTTPGMTLGLRYEGAWSLLPGQVGFRYARFLSQDSSIEWQVEVARGGLWVRPWSLLKRQISLTRVRGERVAFRFRHRVDEAGSRRPAVAAYPSVSGMDDPPLFPSPAPAETDPAALWSIHVDDVDAGVAEIWLQEFRYEGPGHVRGAFQLAPKQRVWVGPAELELYGGTLSAGEHTVARGVEGLVRADVPEFDVKAAEGLGVLRQISGRVDLDAQVAGLSFLDLYDLPGGVTLREGSGQLSTRVTLDRGAAAEGSRVRFASTRLAAQRGAVSVVAGGASAQWDVTRAGATLAVDVPFASLWAAKGEGPVAWAQGVGASLALSSADFAALPSWRARAARADVDAAGADDLARAHDLAGAPDGWALRGGRARGSAHLRANEGNELSGDVRVQASGLALDAGDVRWTGGLSLAAALGPLPPRPGAELPVDVRVEGRDVAFAPPRGGSRSGWWFALEAPRARLAFAPAFSLRAPWSLRARDLSPLTAVLATQRDLPEWLAKWFDLENARASGGVAYAHDQLDFDLAAARAEAFAGQGRYLLAPRGSRGAFRIAAGPLAVGLRLREGQKADLAWPVGPNWLDDEVRALGLAPLRSR